MVIVCSNCSNQLTVPQEMLGKQVKCPICKIVFAAPPGHNVSERPPPERGPGKLILEPIKDDSVPSVQKQGYDDDYDRSPRPPLRSRSVDEDDEDRRSRSRTYYGRYDDDDAEFERMRRRDRSDLERAESAVTGPAVCLIILGVFFLVAALLFLMVSMNTRQVRGERAFTTMAMILCLCWGGLIVLGGVMMKTMKSYALAMTASIMALINHPCFLIHLVFGIWALVVLNQAEVKRAFRWKAEQ